MRADLGVATIAIVEWRTKGDPMIHRSKTHLLLPLLALSVALATAGPVQAGPDVSLQINLGSRPHWENVRGTSVREIRRSDRSDYDVFRYGRNYYAYNHVNGNWYMSRRDRGRYRLIDDRQVPRELRRVPRDHWRNYPTAWEDRGYDRGRDDGYGRGRDDGYDRGYQGSGNTSATFQVTFGSAPRWSNISGSRVQVIPYSERPNYDVFRYGGSYYVYNNDLWYSSTRESGQFTRIDDRSVPNELTSVPREHWRHYPPAWGNNGGNPASNGNGRGRGNNDGPRRGRGN